MSDFIKSITSLFSLTEAPGRRFFSKFSLGTSISNLSTTQKTAALFTLGALFLGGGYIYKRRQALNLMKTHTITQENRKNDTQTSMGKKAMSRKADNKKRTYVGAYLKRCLEKHLAKFKDAIKLAKRELRQAEKKVQSLQRDLENADSGNDYTSPIKSALESAQKNRTKLHTALKKLKQKQERNRKAYVHSTDHSHKLPDGVLISSQNFYGKNSFALNMQIENGTFIAVFHGHNGTNVLNKTIQELPNIFQTNLKKQEDVANALDSSIKEMEKEIFKNNKWNNQGCTCTLTYIFDGKIMVATLGRNEANIYQNYDRGTISANIQLCSLPLSSTQGWTSDNERSRFREKTSIQEEKLKRSYNTFLKEHDFDGAGFNPSTVDSKFYSCVESRSIGDKASNGLVPSQAVITRNFLRDGDTLIVASSAFKKVVSEEETIMIIKKEKAKEGYTPDSLAKALNDYALNKGINEADLALSVVFIRQRT